MLILGLPCGGALPGGWPAGSKRFDDAHENFGFRVTVPRVLVADVAFNDLEIRIGLRARVKRKKEKYLSGKVL